jgi:hypothetical protein
MKVTIDKVTLVGNEHFVHFSTEFGSAIAVWNAVPPAVGTFHDVELEVMERIIWGVNSHCALNNICSIEVESGSIKLTGKIISIEADDTAVMDVAGSVIILDVVGFTEDVPVYVDLKIMKLYLFPTRV